VHIYLFVCMTTHTRQLPEKQINAQLDQISLFFKQLYICSKLGFLEGLTALTLGSHPVQLASYSISGYCCLLLVAGGFLF